MADFILKSAYPAFVDPIKIAAAHERWYAKQPFTVCRRCCREFPNVDNGKTEYCCWECEVGWFQARPPSSDASDRVFRRHPRYKKHLASSRKSNWG